MAIARFVTARERLLAVTDGEHEVGSVLRAALAALHDVARFRWAAVMTVDPDTILPVTGVIDGFEPSACVPFWEAELTLPGYNKFADLARRHDPVATLSEATDGELHRSPAFVNVYAPLGASDELRCVFVQGASCWGIASLVRPAEAGFFTATEVEDVRQLVRFVARALRAATVRAESVRATHRAFVLFDPQDRPVHATAHALDLLEDLQSVLYVSDVAGSAPGVLRALLTRARFSTGGETVESRLRDQHGSWFRASAARTDAGDGSVALVLEPASASDLLSMTMASFGLTEREGHIVRLIARGLATTDIAHELCLSPHTVRDHVKAILHKCDVTSRGELVAALFADNLSPAMHRSVLAGSA